MNWFGNRNREGREAEAQEVKPKNQIQDSPEKETPAAKGKLDRFQDKSPEEQRQSLNEQSQAAKDRQKLERSKPYDADPTKGQRQLDNSRETERE